MADADEAAIHLPSSNDSEMQIETDLSDETQDFRFLNFLSDNSQSSLPKRGEKDFEPNPTLHQADILSASRQAMHNALSYPRLHNPKNVIIGVYAPDGPTPPASAKTTEPAESKKPDTDATATADAEPEFSKKPAGTGMMGVSADACVYVSNPKGQFFRTMGQADRWNRVWLLPEEALYLIERGSLDIRWPVWMTGPAGEVGNEEVGIPMSLQAAYSCFIGRDGLTLERYSVYTGLKRLGYTMLRAASWDEHGDGMEGDSTESEGSQVQKPQGPGLAGIFGRFLEWLSDSSSTGSTATGPLAGVGIHRSYNDIYRRLAIVPWYDPVNPQTPRTPTTPPFRIAFSVYKPSTPFRKTAPPTPDFRIAVVDARRQTTIPTVSQLGALLESTPLDPPQGPKMEKQLYMRLRHGYRNVILAVFDQGVVSYLRVADAAFGKEKIYGDKGAPRGPKNGGYRPKPKR
ncbi:tRNA-splicing endonuclease subunit sen54 [Aspergillus wentii]|nr:tRNA-splicing endonuclease subunit sen54 [Aspergillus wentii]